MSTKYPGGIITAENPVTPSGPYQTSAASGMWTLEQAAYWIKANQWPLAGNIQGYPLWSWGYNDYGQLGQGDTTNLSSPKQIGALTTWSALASGFWSTVATKTDGTLWSWGYNNHGQLGQGDTTDLSSPKQVGSLTAWLALASGDYHTLATKT